MHVCGGLGNVIDEILKFNVNVFDFEFANNTANIDLLSRRDLGGRMIGFGCVDSSIDQVEDRSRDPGNGSKKVWRSSGPRQCSSIPTAG